MSIDLKINGQHTRLKRDHDGFGLSTKNTHTHTHTCIHMYHIVDSWLPLSVYGDKHWSDWPLLAKSKTALPNGRKSVQLAGLHLIQPSKIEWVFSFHNTVPLKVIGFLLADDLPQYKRSKLYCNNIPFFITQTLLSISRTMVFDNG